MSLHSISEGPVSKHAQLRTELINSIQGGRTPGDLMPSERQLMADFGVSRATVRKAIDGLVAEGLLQRIPGKGTFVAQPRMETQLHLASFTQDMRRRGLNPRTIVLQCTQEIAPDAVKQALDLRKGESVWKVSRIRLANGEPIAVENGWYPTSILPQLYREDLTGSLYEILAQKYGKVIDSADQVLWAEVADALIAEQLDVSPGDPLLVFRRTSQAQGQLLEYVVSHYRGDRYQIYSQLSGPEREDTSQGQPV